MISFNETFRILLEKDRLKVGKMDTKIINEWINKTSSLGDSWHEYNKIRNYDLQCIKVRGYNTYWVD